MFQVKYQRSESKTMSGFSITLILKGIMTFQSQRVYAFFWTKNVNFDKNDKEPKMEDPTHDLRETTLALQLI